MEHRQSWCIAALPLEDAAYLTKTWCYFAFWRIHSQTTFKRGSQLVPKWFFFLDYFFPHRGSLPWQSAGVLVPMMSSLRLPATTRGHNRALVIHWQLPLLTFSAGDRLHLLICCAFAVWFAKVLNILCVYGHNLWLFRESEDCCDWQGAWTACSPSM